MSHYDRQYEQKLANEERIRDFENNFGIRATEDKDARRNYCPLCCKTLDRDLKGVLIPCACTYMCASCFRNPPQMGGKLCYSCSGMKVREEAKQYKTNEVNCALCELPWLSECVCSTTSFFMNPKSPTLTPMTREEHKKGGTKDDTGKPQFDRLSFQALGAINDVHKFGDDKYERGNWKKGLHFTRLINATIRHLSAILQQELFDPESKLLHSAHAATNCEMLTHFLLNHEKYKDFDDIHGNNLTEDE